jgi:NADPH:quinone reductase-like Zn-dependent oxidoreductase
MKQTQTIPETFLGVGYARDRAGLPLEALRVPVPQPAADEVLIRVAASSLNPLEYKLADLNFMGRTPPVVLGLDLSGVVVAAGHDVPGVAVGDAVGSLSPIFSTLINGILESTSVYWGSFRNSSKVRTFPITIPACAPAFSRSSARHCRRAFCTASALALHLSRSRVRAANLG